MFIRIYQIDSDRDLDRVKFLSYEDFRAKYPRRMGVPAILYNCVFEGDVEIVVPHNRVLESIYVTFNTDPPKSHVGHSLSVSDIVELPEGLFYCDNVGWQKVHWSDPIYTWYFKNYETGVICAGRRANKYGPDLVTQAVMRSFSKYEEVLR